MNKLILKLCYFAKFVIKRKDFSDLYMKKAFKVFKYILLCVLVFLASICISVFIQTKVNPDKIPSIFGYKPFIVLSGSMESELYKGDLAIVKKVDVNTLKENDVIAFRDEKNHVVTHRIVNVIDNNGKTEFITKGDNNNTNDLGTVKLDDIEGKYSFKISKLGNVLLTLQKPLTLCILLVIILIAGVLWIGLGNNKLSSDERKELEQLRREKQNKNS